MTNEIKTKREELKSISKGFKILVKEGAISSINAGLAGYYAQQGHKVLKTFKQWKEEGFAIKKGSKALLMWGEPKPTKKEEVSDEQKETFFPLAYLFSDLQVEPNKNLSK